MGGQTQEEMVRDLHVMLLGIKDSEDKGLVGDIKDMKKDIKAINGCNRKLAIRFWFLLGLIVGSTGFSLLELSGVINMFGGM